MKRTVYSFAILALGSALLFSCGDSTEGDGHDDHQEMHGEDSGDMDDPGDSGENDGDKATEGDRASMDEMPTIGGVQIQPGTVEADINNWVNGEEDGEIIFILDKIPLDDDGEAELSAEGKAQLDVLAGLLKNNPELLCEVQGHTAKAKNAVGAKTKKAASGARALWVKTKLSLRGVDGKQLSSQGYGDEMLLPDLDPEDDGQKRIAIRLNK